MMIAQQLGLDGNKYPTSGSNAVRNQLMSIMEEYPEAVEDEDLLAAVWLYHYGGFTGERIEALLDESPIKLLKAVYQRQRKVDLRRRKQELRHHYTYSEGEEERRQQAAKGGWR